MWFAGKVQDVTTGLSYFGARFYDPAIGRFMAVDPIEFNEGNLHSFNRYAYANNNPFAFVDPNGEDPYRVFGIAMGLTHDRETAQFLAQAEMGAGHASAALGIEVGNALRDAGTSVRDGGSIETATTVAWSRIQTAVTDPARVLPKKAARGVADANRAASRAKGIPDSQIGPSGKPKIHVKEHATRKRAEDAAQDRSRRGTAPEEHSNPTVGDPHFHPSGSNSREHHTYPGKGFPRNEEY